MLRRRLASLALLITLAVGCGAAPVAHPVPVDMAWVEVDVTALRATEAWRTYGAPWEVALTTTSPGTGDLMTRCDLDLDRLTKLSVAAQPHDMQRRGMAVIEGDFDAQEVLDCVRPSLVEAGEVRFAGRDGVQVRLMGGEEGIVVAMSDSQLLLVLAEAAPAVEAVLNGDAPAASESPFYQATRDALADDVVLTAVITEPPERLPNGTPDALASLQAASVALRLPGGGLDLEARADLGDADAAYQTASMLPLGLMFIGDQLGPIGGVLAQHLRAAAEGDVLVLSLALDAATLDTLLGAY